MKKIHKFNHQTNNNYQGNQIIQENKNDDFIKYNNQRNNNPNYNEQYNNNVNNYNISQL